MFGFCKGLELATTTEQRRLTMVNKIIPLDLHWAVASRVHLPSVRHYVSRLRSGCQLKDSSNHIAWLLRALTCVDLTTLSGDDTAVNVTRLCQSAARPLSDDVLLAIWPKDGCRLHCAAVCVYPARVGDAVAALRQSGASHIPVASVATGFPSGQYCLQSRLREIEFAIGQGASEIDVVINRERALAGDWKAVYDEVCAMRAACGDAHMKVILAIGQLGCMDTVYRAAMVSMMAGADFIKTSTGKESVNATLEVGVVMCRAIQDFRAKTGIMVGLKPAGGIRGCGDALLWLHLVANLLGNEWLHARLFRLGASALVTDLQRQLSQLARH